ncbi:MAG TPA: cell division protein FtsZ [Thermoleophilaceae bacterium]|nr:cell division protein FtsZ [Thermoleophilaceae bacterium]
MASAKRASMREGPLADLFRRTERSGGQDADGAGHRAPEKAVETEAEPRAGRSEAARPEPQPYRPAPAEAVEEVSDPVRHVREPAAAPTPRDRLRSVFSSDLPENMLERAEPERARYGRETPTAPVAQPVLEPVLRVVGVGGAGVNAVDRMIEAQVKGVDFLAVNTDLQSLQGSSADEAIHIGAELTRGLGSGSVPDLGRRAAMEDYDRVKAALKGSDMVFIAAGEGGGTGTGAAPVVARIAREVGALTVGIVTKPFGFEGTRRAEQAERGVEELADEVDTLIVIPNARLLTVLDRQTSMVDAFRMADDVLRQGVQGISDLITLPGLINLDFADVRTIMSDAGQALLGIGMGAGDGRAMEAAARAVASPLLDTSVDGARSILLSITGGHDLSLWEVNEAAKAVAEVAHPESNIIFGAMVDERLADEVWITVVATGYGDGSRPRRPEESSLLERFGSNGGERGRPSGREHHLRRDGRRQARRRRVLGDGGGDRLRRSGHPGRARGAPDPAGAQPVRGAGGRAARPAPLAHARAAPVARPRA